MGRIRLAFYFTLDTPIITCTASHHILSVHIVLGWKSGVFEPEVL